MSRLDNARKFRKEFEANKKATQKLIRADQLTDEEKLELIEIYEDWKVGEALSIGDYRKHNGKLYEVIQGHTTQADWTPASVPALWKEITPATTDEGTEIVPDWVQPAGAHDAYKKGDKVLFEGKVYESLIDGNAHSPAANPAGWREVI